ncbi:hypothetical protein ACERCG_12075 [Mannheimia sp. E30BD]|uniref:CDI toxin immunity protein n=1 Tax=Mannheimia sp. E30BD TaxID=3278708 RepID=UPI00359E548D
MTLFEECKSVLNEHFYQLTENESKIIKLKLEGYLNNESLNKPTIISIDNILCLASEKKIYVIADDVDIPIFETTISLLFENIYDVICLATKIYFMSEEMIIYSSFPHEIFYIFDI